MKSAKFYTGSLLIGTAILGIIDGVSTYIGVKLGLIEELNPLWIGLLMYMPEAFLAIKIVMTLALCLGLWSLVNSSGFVFYGSLLTFTAYTCLILYQAIVWYQMV